MKTIRKILFAGSFCLLFNSAFAGGALDSGIEFHNGGFYEAAKYQLLEAAKGGSAEAYYYLGDSYLMLGNVDSAAICFKKSAELKADYALPLVGEGKLELKKNNASTADNLFNAAIKKDKKNPDIYNEIAVAYATYKQFDKAKEMITKAADLKKNYAPTFVAEGDVLFREGQVGEAVSRYENALYFDANNKEALLKAARAYGRVNPARGTENLDKAIAIDANYIPAYIEKANLLYGTRAFSKAIPVYEKYVNLPGIPSKEYETYATVLYFMQDYAKSLEKAEIALKKMPDNFIMKRIQMYDVYELGDMERAFELGAAFFRSKKPTDEYIAQDYITYAKVLSRKKLDEQAIEYYQKALEKDPKQVDLYKDIAASYEKMEKYNEAIDAYKKYLDGTPKPSELDYYALGRTYYLVASQKATANDLAGQKEYLAKSDSLFALVSSISPDYYLGYFWRARTAALLEGDDLTKGVAKPYYEQSLEKLIQINTDGKRNKDVVECCLYLGNCYYQNNDTDKAIEYFNKVLEINPNNADLKKAIQDLQKKK